MDDQSEGAHQQNEADQYQLEPNVTAEQYDQNMSGEGRGNNGEYEEEKKGGPHHGAPMGREDPNDQSQA